MNFNHFIAAIWFAGALVFLATTILSVKERFFTVAGMSLASGSLLALTGVMYWMKASA